MHPIYIKKKKKLAPLCRKNNIQSNNYVVLPQFNPSSPTRPRYCFLLFQATWMRKTNQQRVQRSHGHLERSTNWHTSQSLFSPLLVCCRCVHVEHPTAAAKQSFLVKLWKFLSDNIKKKLYIQYNSATTVFFLEKPTWFFPGEKNCYGITNSNKANFI